MFDAATGTFAANKVMRKLGESGQIGRIETNPKGVEILPLGEYEFNTGTLNLTHSDAFAEGRKVTVTLDGVKYTDVVKSFVMDMDGTTTSMFYVGNASIIGGEDTSEPYSLALSGYGFQMCVIAELTGEVESSTHTVSIYAETATIHPIDPKYLPGVCLPVVELSTVIKDRVMFTEEECSALSAAYELGTPIVLKCSVYMSAQTTATDCAIVANRGNMQGAHVFLFDLSGATISLVQPPDIGGVWGVAVE